MANTWKKVLTLCLAMLMVLGCFAACGSTQESNETTEPLATQNPEEAKTLKVLTLGHSLAVDAGHMLAMIADMEGYEELVVGTLYYSGCPLNKHVQFLTENSRSYELYLSSTETANVKPKIIKEMTMADALKFDYWDIIIMQAGVFEIGEAGTYTDGNIQTIQNYVKENATNPGVTFAWNMTWAPPVDTDLQNLYTKFPNYYVENYKTYNSDRTTLYNAVTKCVSDHIVTDESFAYVIPSATVMENALSSYLTEKDIHRDFVHATDLARVMVSYTWFCKLTGIDQLQEIKLDTIPKQFLVSSEIPLDWTLTEGEKALILETVNNALKNPMQMTQSQYTEAPAK